ncbi:D-alanyl-D-alanine carboxypeptidase (penicillin-binding protein 5/6) [Kibdelosporangium banguiense]|uniref:D-alanyl-D-alanine carboxypeptidase (Penicillin-binding protein 5/6) n=1 Tax=Kibdelosporangium banguiense TaxID=1365924 RepID=A0ABS4TF47_9PSEU|nr:D-alanyl-D-alanine carboxypeptidase [Kibdelosporangium banguiense]MBP2322700.1 D-alanyl-D-alanine carboxypeptidase (penicillin-binding protein 5/6) [Kibdelosporangium banguiense]
MPERDRQLARVLNLSLSIAAAVTFAVVPAANAAPDSRLMQQPTSPSNPRGSTSSSGSSKPSSSGTTTKSSEAPAPSVCREKAVPPPANDGNGDQMPPLEIPDVAIGGPLMGDCGVVLPRNATPPPDRLTSESWLIADQTTGDVLAAYAPHARQRPAGTIKVLLAILALRELPADKIIVGTKEDTRQQGTKVGIVADGKYLAGDLIRALIATPAADATSALSRELGGMDTTVEKLNGLAKELKALDTRVVNPNGNDVPGQSTSAFDTALIYREAMRVPAFAEATGSKTAEIKPQGSRNTRISRTNDNKLLSDYKGATGGKAGSTNAAKNTFVGSAEKDDRHLIVSIMRSDKAPFEQAGSLLDYGFTLAGARVQPVGQLGSTTSQAPQTSRDTNVQGTSGQSSTQAGGPNALQRSAFGTFGLPVTILAGVVVLIGVLMTMRRKMQRAKRLRAQQAQ